jgi:gliding motility-associated-like protein
LIISNITTGLNGASYRVLVRGDFTSPTPSAAAVLTVITSPASPAVTGAASCSGQTLTVSASGGTNGQYRWYDALTGGVAKPGEINNTYTTPPLTATTSYFAGIYDGTCESIRKEVIATINPLPTAPTVTNASRCSSGTLTLTASGTTNGNYRWYNIATGGTALAGEVNSSFITPVLTSSTSYYASIHNGTCESIRIVVNASVNTPPAKPVITSSITPSSGTVSLCNNSVVFNAPAGFSAYLWSTGAVSQQITVTQPGVYTLQVTDANNCTSVSSDVINVVILATICNTAPVIKQDTVTARIQGKITVNILSQINDVDNNLDLTTLRIVSQPVSGATATINANGDLILDYTNTLFSGTDKLTVEICDMAGSCTQQTITVEVVGDIVVYNAVSADGNNLNAKLVLEYIDLFPDTKKNHVTIYNRWGSIVFDVHDYDNNQRAFTGQNNNGNDLPTGTYFYKIDFYGKRKLKTGYLTLKR